MIRMKINHYSKVLGCPMDCNVLLPDESVDANKKYKSIWLCHGGSGDENEWLYNSTVATLVDTEKLAFVIVNVNDSCFVDMPFGGKYGTYVGKELPQIIHSNIKVLSDRREDNFISGLSNGGYGSFIVGLLNADRFGAIGAFSAGDKADATPKPFKEGEMNPRIRMFGAIDISDTDYSIKHLARRVANETGPKPYIYHACGGKDPWLDLNILVKECFEEINLTDYHYKYDQIEEYGHEWPFWDIEIRKFIGYLKENTSQQRRSVYENS